MTDQLLSPDAALQAVLADASQGTGPLAGAFATAPDKTAFANKVTADWQAGVKKEGKGVNVSNESAQGIFSSLISRNFQGALMSLLMQLEPIKKFISTLMTYAGSKISGMFSKDTPSLSWSEASAKVDRDAKIAAGVDALAAGGYITDSKTMQTALNNARPGTQLALEDSKPAADKIPANLPGLNVVPGTGAAEASADSKIPSRIFGADGQPVAIGR